MLKIMLALLIGLNISVTPTATVDRIEGDYAVVEVGNKMVDIEVEDFNHPIAEGNNIAVSITVGTFGSGFQDIDNKTYYQFKSYDDTVWWVLTTKEIGFVPSENKTYTLVYYDNNTTECLECAEEFECECEVYDDIFLAIYEGGI